MKTRTKALVLSLCAILLVATTVLATLAYLQSSSTVTNTFTLGKIAITLDEAKVNDMGEIDAEADRVQANVYKLVPGRTYAKDPTVHVQPGSEPCYLFVKLANGLGGTGSIEDTTNAATTIAKQMEKNGWIKLSGATDVYYYQNTIASSDEVQDVPVFQTFKVAGKATMADLEKFASASIDITAYAVQTDGFNTAKEAWTASGFGK